MNMRITYYSLFSRNPLFKYEKSENRGSSDFYRTFQEFSKTSNPRIHFSKVDLVKSEGQHLFHTVPFLKNPSIHEIHFSKVDSVKTGVNTFFI